MKIDLSEKERRETATAIRTYIWDNKKRIDDERVRNLERSLEKIVVNE